MHYCWSLTENLNCLLTNLNLMIQMMSLRTMMTLMRMSLRNSIPMNCWIQKMNSNCCWIPKSWTIQMNLRIQMKRNLIQMKTSWILTMTMSLSYLMIPRSWRTQSLNLIQRMTNWMIQNLNCLSLIQMNWMTLMKTS